MTGVPIASPVYTLGDWQANVVDEHGVAWICEREEGWSSSPPVRPIVEERQASDGAWSGPGFHGPRVISLSGRAYIADQVAMLQAKDRIRGVIGPRALMQLRVDEMHLSRVASVRLTDTIELADEGAHKFSWQLTVTAPDPRRYAAVSVTETATLPATLTAGRVYARSYDLVFGGVTPGGSGSVFIDQQGTYDETPALITFVGPVITPRVEHVQSGRSLTFNLTVEYGQTLVVDLGAKTALLNGTANRAADLSAGSAWFMLAPGTNELAFRGQAGSLPPEAPPDAVPLMHVTAASAWS
uniref:phage distal tail protein n=1 Tax=Nonomuraea sp. CA-251285 TaxID=3240002 RepID=UPI003F49108C